MTFAKHQAFDAASQMVPDEQFVKNLPLEFSRSQSVMGVLLDSVPTLIYVNETGYQACDVVRRRLRGTYEIQACEESTLLEQIHLGYERYTRTASDIIRENKGEQLQVFGDDATDLLAQAGVGPVVQIVSTILQEAIAARASDIHIQPGQKEAWARFRIDGVLHDAIHIPIELQDEVLSRIKVLGGMNIAERRLPQDGRASVKLGARIVDLRIASLPTSHDERIVIRLLDKSARLYSLTEIGMNSTTLETFRKVISHEHGLMLVTGPTGSGKSTTLYAALQEINSKEKNILTLEDPIEYALDGISQTQINEKKGLTFATGLRSVLRQDPDIIMVGEIRDHETAVMAIQSSLTGHLVFSTLHTNDSASAVTRLQDLGIEPYLVSSSLLAVLAQRLVRRFCGRCRIESNLPEDLRQRFLAFEIQPPSKVYVGQGCDDCYQTGYHGRLGLYELLTIDESCQALIQQRANAAQIRKVAFERGLTFLVHDGISKIESGRTSPAEVLRVAQH